MPPNWVAFVAVVAFVALVAFVAFVAFVAEATVPDTLLPDTELICASCTQLEHAFDSPSAEEACVAFVAVAALVAFVAFVAVVALVAFVAFMAEATVPETLLPDTELICASCTQLEHALDSASAADAFTLRTA